MRQAVVIPVRQALSGQSRDGLLILLRAVIDSAASNAIVLVEFLPPARMVGFVKPLRRLKNIFLSEYLCAAHALKSYRKWSLRMKNTVAKSTPDWRVVWFLLAAVQLLPAAQAGAGTALKEAWSCAKSTLEAQVDIAGDLIKKGEAVASLSGTAGMCLASSGADQTGFAITMGALTAIKLGAPDSLPDGKCKSAVQTTVAKPFGAGLAAVIPSGKVRDNLKTLLESEEGAAEIWQQMSKLPPPVQTVLGHVDCACEFIDTGVSVADLSAVSSAVKQVSESCGSFLDEAGLGFINDWGGAAVGAFDDTYTAVGEALSDLQNIPEAAPDHAVYFGFWGAYVPVMAETRLLDPAINLGTAKWANAAGSWITLGPNCYQFGCQIDMPKMYDSCHDYYRSHRVSAKNAHKRCSAFRTQASNEANTLYGHMAAINATPDLFKKKMTIEVEKNWVWRLPYQTATSPYSKLDNHWSSEDALNYVYQDVLGQKTKGKKWWDAQLTGGYAAARTLLPNVSFNTEQATQMAVAGATGGLDNLTRQRWLEYGDEARQFWMGKWLETVAFGGSYGCPANAILQTACVKKLAETFDKVCLLAIASAHLDTPNVVVAGARLAKARQNCLSWLQPMQDKITAVVNVGPGYLFKQLCLAYESRSEAGQACVKLVSETTQACAQTVIAAGGNAQAMHKCLNEKRPGLYLRMNPTPHVTKQTPTQTPTTIPVKLMLSPATTESAAETQDDE